MFLNSVKKLAVLFAVVVSNVFVVSLSCHSVVVV
jgi:hypothetical protein